MERNKRERLDRVNSYSTILSLRMWPLLGVAATVVLSGCATSRDKHATARAPMEMSYDAFDQSLTGGWRAIADKGNYVDAAKLIDHYDRDKPGLEEWQHVNLRFHAGQLYAFAGLNKRALARFRSSLYAHEPDASPVRWNAYVRATIAFLEHDRATLLDCREEIAQGPAYNGVVLNLDVVDRLIERFGESYHAAYSGNSSAKPKTR